MLAREDEHGGDSKVSKREPVMATRRRFVRLVGVGSLVAAVVVVGTVAVSAPAGATGLTWSAVRTPKSPTPAQFLSVACVTGSDCWAVGFAGSGAGNAEQSLAEHWAGKAWSVVATPHTGPSGSQSNLTGVACVTSSDCWAVGGSSSNGVNWTRADHWDGTAWSLVPTPHAGVLNSVACTTESDCWAVGSGLPAGETLAEHWDGTAWSVVTTPDSRWPFNYLYGVACTSTSDCWAVGYAAGARTPIREENLAEHWDGTAWSIVATPSNPSQSNLMGVSCVRSTDCWAVGLAGDRTGVQKAAAEQWDGTTWSRVAIPSGHSTLLGVSCVSASDCWAVGPGNIDHWDGTAWSNVATPNGALRTVTCDTSTDCWAMGLTAPNVTLAEHGTSLEPPSISARASRRHR